MPCKSEASLGCPESETSECEGRLLSHFTADKFFCQVGRSRSLDKCDFHTTCSGSQFDKLLNMGQKAILPKLQRPIVPQNEPMARFDNFPIRLTCNQCHYYHSPQKTVSCEISVSQKTIFVCDQVSLLRNKLKLEQCLDLQAAAIHNDDAVALQVNQLLSLQLGQRAPHHLAHSAQLGRHLLLGHAARNL